MHSCILPVMVQNAGNWSLEAEPVYVRVHVKLRVSDGFYYILYSVHISLALPLSLTQKEKTPPHQLHLHL